MNLQSLMSQLSMSNNPFNMAMNMLPNNLKQPFASIANSNNDEERAQKIANICNRHGITKNQLAQIFKLKRF